MSASFEKPITTLHYTPNSNFPSETYGKNWSLNKTITFNIDYIWKIEDFDKTLTNLNKELKSPLFSVENHDVIFQMQILKHTKNNIVYIGLYLNCICGEKVVNETPVTYKLSITDAFNNLINSFEGSHTFVEDYGHGLMKFIEVDNVINQLNNQHNDKSLNICCKATVSYCKTSKFILRQKKLLDSGKNSDVAFIIGDFEIPAHKTILSAHSPVFEAMFSHDDTKEAQEKKVTITDAFADVFKIFLLFIYTGIKPTNNFKKILEIANKYQVDELKFYCENYLLANLNNENVVETYQLAELHNAETLKNSCLIFIARNFSQIVKTDDWKKFCDISTSEEIVEITRLYFQIQASKQQ